MPRYFIELAYKGANYSGFQIQQNANSIQAELTKALNIIFKAAFELTGSSRTDTGVHALQNFFHFDSDVLPEEKVLTERVYNLNAILPNDIVVKKIYEVAPDANCRFDAKSREYQYYIYQHKDPFLEDRAFYYPYTLDIDKLNAAAAAILNYTDFTSFAKKNSQVKTFDCTIVKSEWRIENELIIYNVQGNRFLRGMVRGLVGTMLRAGSNKISMNDFIAIIENKDAMQADFSVPPQGLFLCSVNY
jgi:tRNA pseudouridine38-40 synthase